MIEIKGNCNTAIVYTDELESGAEGQIKALCDQSFISESKIRIMPDVHAGKGCTIGTTMTITDKAVPNLVGVDIGCGMETVKFTSKKVELQKLDTLIREKIPSGMNIRNQPHVYADEIDLTELRCFRYINHRKALNSIGTLGGGNHFIEIDVDSKGSKYLIIHSGSRHLGVEVASYYQEAGFKSLPEGAVPYELAYVYGGLFDNYIHDMKIVQKFAEINRRAMVREIIKGMKLNVEESFTTVHNYIDTDAMILRKGAVSAQSGEKLLIPINMRDGSLICTGKGNPDWNFSAPHGAGRLYGRKEAKESFTLSQFKKEMAGIYSTSISKNTLDECPMAYKNMDDIVKNITPTAEIVEVIKPIYNFKAQ